MRLAAAARAWSRASSRRPGSRPPATATSGLLPPPPPTVRAASAMRSDAVEAAVLGHRRHQGRRRRPRARRPAPPPARRAGRGRPGPGRAGRRGWCRRPGPRPRRRPRPAPARPPARTAPALRSWPDLVGQRLLLLEQLLHPLGHLGRRHPQEGGGAAQGGLLVADAVEAGHAGDGLDAAQVGADGALAQDLDGPDGAQGVDVGAAAQLDRPVARPRSTRTTSPYFSPKKAMAPSRSASSLDISVALTALVGDDLLVGQVLDPLQLLGGDRRVVAEVEPQPVGRHQRAGLLDVVAQHLPQGPVEQVGAGVVAADGLPPVGVDRGGGLLAGADLALHHPGRRGGAGRAGRRWCRAPRRVPVSVVIVPVSPTWPPASA